MRFRYVLLVVCAASSVTCSSGPTVQPSPSVEDPIVNCPSDISITAHNGATPAVTFDAPVAVKGSPPVTVACAPASGTSFKNGVTTVTCEATDARSHKASCSFTVTVTPVPQLVKTSFLAFGDSLTEGKTTLVFHGAVQVPPRDPPVFNSSVSYVEQLYVQLAARYQDQTVTIIAEGFGGQTTGEDKDRERAELDQFKPDAILLLEGTNDMLQFPDAPGIDSAAEALQRMVRDAKARGVRVFLATLPAINSHAPAYVNKPTAETAVPLLNARIRALAAAESVTLVDLYNVIPTTELGSDGVHLKASGYKLMADEWFKAIVATLEVKPALSSLN